MRELAAANRTILVAYHYRLLRNLSLRLSALSVKVVKVPWDWLRFDGGEATEFCGGGEI
jgi:hypothetical protein